MEQSKLAQIITEKNAERERLTLRTAEATIEEIASEQRKIRTSTERIAKLRKELADLSVDTLDAKELLGE